MRKSLAIIALLLIGGLAHATILPPNNLYLEDDINSKDANINEVTFHKIINDIVEVYKPIVASHGATLRNNNRWTDSTVNASAQQSGNTWIINMYGGLARRSEVTPDGFALVVCHELGHHLGGFPFYGERWAASEGQSDYFATQSCARLIWGEQHEKNAEFRASVDPVAKSRCDASWSTVEDQNLCYRTSMGGLSLARLLAALGRTTTPRFETPNPTEVSKTKTSHPEGQCRLDTYFHGALCGNAFDENIIPGRRHASGQTSRDAEILATQYSCTRAGFDIDGLRPRCWFKPEVDSLLQLKTLAWAEKGGNKNGHVDPGENFEVMATIHNLTNRDFDSIKTTLTSENSAINVTIGESEINDVRSKEEAHTARPFEASVDESVTCGEKIPVNVGLEIGPNKRASLQSHIQVGYMNELANLMNKNRMDIPDKNQEGIFSEVSTDLNSQAFMATVSVDITHTYIGDLRVHLIAPDGQTFVLHNRQGGNTDNLKKSFDLEFASGIKSQGTWKLQVADTASSDRGHLNEWSLKLVNAVCE